MLAYVLGEQITLLTGDDDDQKRSRDFLVEMASLVTYTFGPTNRINYHGQTPLMYVMRMKPHPELLTVLVTEAVQKIPDALNFQDERGWTVVHECALLNSSKIFIRSNEL